MSDRPPYALLLNWMTEAFKLAPTSEPVASDVIWNDGGVLTLSVGIPPAFSDHPDDTTAADGATATFSVTASNATSYQWQKQESGAGAWSNVSGATSASYTTGTLSFAADNTDKYRCVATGPGGSTTSNSATLTISLSPPSGTSIWLRAQDEAYSNGANVSQWSDKSGNARHFTIGSNYPTFATAANNGKAAITFNGTNQGLNRSYTGSGTGYTIGCILAQDSNAFRVWWQNGVAPYLAHNDNTPRIFRGSLLEASTLVPWTNWIPVVYRVNGTTAEIWISNTKVASGSVTSGALAVAGLGNLSGFEWNGKMQEVIAYESALSDGNLESLITYLEDQAGAKFGRFISCDGDSLTAGTSETPWPTLLATDLGSDYEVRNVATGGHTIVFNASSTGYLNSDVTTTVDPYSAIERLDGLQHIVVAWAGTNDLYYGRTGAQAHADFAAYCAARRAAGAVVIAINIIARTETGGTWTTAKQSAFNALFATDAASYSDAQIDAAATFNDPTNATLYNVDQTHLTTAGAQVIANAVAAAIQGLP